MDDETYEHIIYAHQRLPELFSRIKTDNKIIYPFKYDSTSGEFLYSDLEKHLRNNISKGNGKARSSGFAIQFLAVLQKSLLMLTY